MINFILSIQYTDQLILYVFLIKNNASCCYNVFYLKFDTQSWNLGHVPEELSCLAQSPDLGYGSQFLLFHRITFLKKLAFLPVHRFQRATIRIEEKILLGNVAGSVKDEPTKVDTIWGPDGGLVKVGRKGVVDRAARSKNCGKPWPPRARVFGKYH